MNNWTYTTAGEEYDGFGTRTLKIAGKTNRSKVVRLVMTPEPHVGWQRARYSSGLHLAVDIEEWRKLVAYGLAVEIE
jgi:hypothetical protein